ncbi:MAG: hypothetical protein U0838_04760 [Chloroflexota bacterium]
MSAGASFQPVHTTDATMAAGKPRARTGRSLPTREGAAQRLRSRADNGAVSASGAVASSHANGTANTKSAAGIVMYTSNSAGGRRRTRCRARR